MITVLYSQEESEVWVNITTSSTSWRNIGNIAHANNSVAFKLYLAINKIFNCNVKRILLVPSQSNTRNWKCACKTQMTTVSTEI